MLLSASQPSQPFSLMHGRTTVRAGRPTQRSRRSIDRLSCRPAHPIAAAGRPARCWAAASYTGVSRTLSPRRANATPHAALERVPPRARALASSPFRSRRRARSARVRRSTRRNRSLRAALAFAASAAERVGREQRADLVDDALDDGPAREQRLLRWRAWHARIIWCCTSTRITKM